MLVNRKVNVHPDLRKYQPRVWEPLPKLIWGSIDHNDYWEEERDRCINGYKPPGMSWIPGKFYFWLNYWRMTVNDPSATAENDRKVIGAPFYRDMDERYFKHLYDCKVSREGAIALKARDKGFSMMNACSTLHEFTFFPVNEVALVAGLEATTTSLATKVMTGHQNLPIEFRNNINLNNDDIVTSLVEVKEKGQYIKEGLKTMIHLRTMGLNPNVFKGERLAEVTFEEAGEFKKLIEGFQATEPCFRDGSNQYGLPIVGGTGGDILNVSKDFMEMWYDHKIFNLNPIFIPVTYSYKGFFDFTTGTSDLAGAEKHILAERAKKKKGSQLQYNLYVQNYPLIPSDSFLKATGSPFNLNIINDQRSMILEGKVGENEIQTGRLEWIDKPAVQEGTDGKFFDAGLNDVGVKFVPDPDGYIRMLKPPILNEDGTHVYQNLDVGGIDSIDQDEAGSTDSKGAIVIYRRFENLSIPYNLPVAMVHFRSARSTEFYEIALKLAIFYNCKMLVEYTKIGIIDYFKRNRAQRYLKEKPKSVHNSDTKTRNVYGVHMNKQIKEVGIELMADDIDANGGDIWFIELLNELADFGDRNTDIAMAYMMAIIHAYDMAKIMVRESNENKKPENKYKFKKWETDRKGNLVLSLHEQENVWDDEDEI